MIHPDIRARAIDALKASLNAHGCWLPVETQPAAVDAVLALCAAELDASQRRAVRLVERIGDARTWARKNLTAEQERQLLAILGGRSSVRD